MAVALVKPSGAGSATNPSGGNIGTSTANEFVIKVFSHQSRDFTRIEETTGAEDAQPEFDNNGYVYANGILSGAMVAASAVGFENLKGSSVSLVFQWDSGRKTTRTVLIEDIRISWRSGRTYVGVSMSYVQTATATSTVEGAV